MVHAVHSRLWLSVFGRIGVGNANIGPSSWIHSRYLTIYLTDLPLLAGTIAGTNCGHNQVTIAGTHPCLSYLGSQDRIYDLKYFVYSSILLCRCPCIRNLLKFKFSTCLTNSHELPYRFWHAAAIYMYHWIATSHEHSWTTVESTLTSAVHKQETMMRNRAT